MYKITKFPKQTEEEKRNEILRKTYENEKIAH